MMRWLQNALASGLLLSGLIQIVEGDSFFNDAGLKERQDWSLQSSGCQIGSIWDIDRELKKKPPQEASRPYLNTSLGRLQATFETGDDEVFEHPTAQFSFRGFDGKSETITGKPGSVVALYSDESLLINGRLSWFTTDQSEESNHLVEVGVRAKKHGEQNDVVLLSFPYGWFVPEHHALPGFRGFEGYADTDGGALFFDFEYGPVNGTLVLDELPNGEQVVRFDIAFNREKGVHCPRGIIGRSLCEPFIEQPLPGRPLDTSSSMSVTGAIFDSAMPDCAYGRAKPALVTEPVTPGDPADFGGGHCPDDDFVVMSGASANWFPRLHNLIGSIHVWEPHRRIEIYDFGLNETQLCLLNATANVMVVSLPASDIDAENHPHRADLGSYAWKSLVVRDGLRRHACVMWLDSGMELRRSISDIRHDLDRDGYWLSANGYYSPDVYPVPRFTPLVALQSLGDNVTFDRFLPFKYVEVCATFLGMARTGPGARLVLEPWLDCSLNETCLLPMPHLTRANYLQDQTMLNVVAFRPGGLAEYLRSSNPIRRANSAERCSALDGWATGAGQKDCSSMCPHDVVHMSRRYWLHSFEPLLPDSGPNMVTENPLDQNDAVLFVRRGYGDHPYTQYFQLEPTGMAADDATEFCLVDNTKHHVYVNESVVETNNTVRWKERFGEMRSPRSVLLSNTSRGSKRPFHMAMCAAMQNEGPYLAEWIEYHHMLGVDHFWLYEDGSSDNWAEVLEPYVNENLVTVDRQFLSRYAQAATLEHCLAQHQFDADWIAFMDIDEYIAIVPPLQSLTELVARYKNHAGLFLASKAFGPSGHMNRSGDISIASYTRYKDCRHCDTPEGVTEAQIDGKTILNLNVVALEYCGFTVDYGGGYAHNPLGSYCQGFNMVHQKDSTWFPVGDPKFAKCERPDIVAVDTSFRTVTQSWHTDPPPPYDVAYVGHFLMRSCEEYAERTHQRRAWIVSATGEELVEEATRKTTQGTKWIAQRIGADACHIMEERATAFDGTLEKWAPSVRARLAARASNSTPPRTLEQHRDLHVTRQLEGIERRLGQKMKDGVRYVADWLQSLHDNMEGMLERWQPADSALLTKAARKKAKKLGRGSEGPRVLIAGDPPQYVPLLLSINRLGETRVLSTVSFWFVFLGLPSHLVRSDLVLPVWFPNHPTSLDSWPSQISVPSAVTNAPWDVLIMDFTGRFQHLEHQANAYALVLRELYKQRRYRKPLDVFVHDLCHDFCNRTLIEECGGSFVSHEGAMLHYRFSEAPPPLESKVTTSYVLERDSALRSHVPLAVCGIFEPAQFDQLSEWLDFHSSQGVGHAFLYEDPKAEPMREKPWRSVAAPFVAQGMLTLYEAGDQNRVDAQNMTQESVRAHLYQTCLSDHNKTADWVAFMPGLDHYLTSRWDRTMVSTLESYQEHVAVVASVLPFGPNGWVNKRPPASAGSFLVDYTMAAGMAVDSSFVLLIQTATAPLEACRFYSEHEVAMNCFSRSPGTVVTMENFDEQHGANKIDRISFNQMHVGHYVTRSCPEYHELRQRQSRSFAVSAMAHPEDAWRQSLSECMLFNTPRCAGGVFDTSALRFVSQMEDSDRWRKQMTGEMRDMIRTEAAEEMHGMKKTDVSREATWLGQYHPPMIASSALSQRLDTFLPIQREGFTIVAHEHFPCIFDSAEDLHVYGIMVALREAGHQILPVFGRLNACTGVDESQALLDLGIDVVYVTETVANTAGRDGRLGIVFVELVDIPRQMFEQVDLVFATLSTHSMQPRCVGLPLLAERLRYLLGPSVDFVLVMYDDSWLLSEEWDASRRLAILQVDHLCHVGDMGVVAMELTAALAGTPRSSVSNVTLSLLKKQDLPAAEAEGIVYAGSDIESMRWFTKAWQSCPLHVDSRSGTTARQPTQLFLVGNETHDNLESIIADMASKAGLIPVLDADLAALVQNSTGSPLVFINPMPVHASASVFQLAMNVAMSGSGLPMVSTSSGVHALNQEFGPATELLDIVVCDDPCDFAETVRSLVHRAEDFAPLIQQTEVRRLSLDLNRVLRSLQEQKSAGSTRALNQNEGRIHPRDGNVVNKNMTLSSNAMKVAKKAGLIADDVASEWSLHLTPSMSVLTEPATLFATIEPRNPMLVEAYLDGHLLTLLWEVPFPMRLIPQDFLPGDHVLELRVVDWTGEVVHVHTHHFSSSTYPFLSPLSRFFENRTLSEDDALIHPQSPLLVRTLLSQLTKSAELNQDHPSDRPWNFRFESDFYGVEIVSADSDAELSRVFVRSDGKHNESVVLAPLPPVAGKVESHIVVPRLVVLEKHTDTLWAFHNIRPLRQSRGVTSWQAEEALIVEKQSETIGHVDDVAPQLSPVGMIQLEELNNYAAVQHAICLSVHKDKAGELPRGMHFQFLTNSPLTEDAPSEVTTVFRALEQYGMIVCDYHTNWSKEAVYVFFEQHHACQISYWHQIVGVMNEFFPEFPWHLLRATMLDFSSPH